jgi:mono/diheme cytochrome c family protein
MKRIQRWIVIGLVGWWLLGGGGNGADVEARLGEAEVRFNRDIRPILSDRCFSCHGPDEKNRKAGLRLDTFDGATKDRGGYRVIAPGRPQESELLRRVTSQEAMEVMPPPTAKRLPITPAEAELIRRWIAQGASYEGHWAFQPLSRVAPPSVRQRDWLRNEIDSFVLSRLEAEGIAPSPQADPATLMRRLSLDLTGLLPSPEEVDRFVAAFESGTVAQQEHQYRQLVDRLLASPHYGERWGRHWLDQARYADTHGYTIDGEREMWPYRDWVIRAINQDLPFDRFTIEQLAGDLLPLPDDPRAAKAQLIATGFHRNTVINQEGGVDPEQARVEQVMDRVNTTGAVWLGLTVGCAQCHTHKYDPISHREYYQLFSFFNSTLDYNNLGPTVFVEPGELLGDPPPTPSSTRLGEWMEGGSREAWERQERARLEKSPAVQAPPQKIEWTPFRAFRTLTEAHAQIELQADGSYIVPANGSIHDAYLLLGRLDRPEVPAVRLRFEPEANLPNGGPGLGQDGAFLLSEIYIESEGGAHRFIDAFASEEDPAWPARAATDNDRRTGWTVPAGVRAQEPREIVLVFAPGKKFDSRQVEFVLRHDTLPNQGVGRFRIEIASGVPHDARGAALLAALRRPVSERTAAQRQMVEAAYASARAVRERQVPGKAMAMIMRDVAAPRPSYVLLRGDFTRPDREGGRLAPDVLGAIAPALPPSVRPRNRLDLARWLVDPSNPLTPRVTVNRVWMRYFGRGLVETEEDFGTQGSPPTHPQLLDWLAGEWIRRGWSSKALHRLIVTSMTYRQSSLARPDLEEHDPRNLLLARQERLRVEAEIIRDLALSASGLLQPALGGPSVRPPQPEGVYAFTQVNKRWMTASGSDRYRRTLYTFFVRSAPYPLFTTFDAPDFQTVCTRRPRSNTPLQSLTLANDPALLELADGLAARLVREVPGAFDEQLDARLDRAFRLSVSRPPTPPEHRELRGFVLREMARFGGASPPASTLPTGLAEGGLSRSEALALTSAIRVLFNTDLFITRE